MTVRPRVRVLHVLGSLGVGGVETWLVRVAREVDRERVAMDFQLHAPDDGPNAAAVRQLGCRVFVNPYPRAPWRYAARLSKLLRRDGPFDVVHSHVHNYSGVVLAVAAHHGVPRRIAHAHTDTSQADGRGSLPRRAYLAGARALIRRYMTTGCAASAEAARALFGSRWKEDGRIQLVPCGVDLAPFEVPADGGVVRRELGIPDGVPVFGHVGRFAAPKNHRFLVEIASALVDIVPGARFLWVGDGPLRAEIAARVAAAGLGDRVLMPGTRHDLAPVLAAMDTFLFPSLWEGMPVSLVEAQASGLPCVVSARVTQEAYVTPSRVTALPIEAGAAAWARAAAAATAPRDRDGARRVAMSNLRGSALDVRASARALEGLYGG